MKDYYEILGVNENSSNEDIKKAYKKLAKEYHPDTHPNDKECENKFKDITEAYETLSDEEKKSNYDFQRKGFNSFDPFGFNPFGNSPFRREDNAESLVMNINLDLEDVLKDTSKEYFINRKIRCKKCNGEGGFHKVQCSSCNGSGMITRVIAMGFMTRTTCSRCGGRGFSFKEVCDCCRGEGLETIKEKVSITIPRGVDNGERLIVRGKGNENRKGTSVGNLYVNIYLNKHKYFTRTGSNLIIDITIPFVYGILGTSIELPSLDGENIYLDIPRGTKNNSILTIPNKGVYSKYSNSSRGNILVRVLLDTSIDFNEGVINKLEKLKENIPFKLSINEP